MITLHGLYVVDRRSGGSITAPPCGETTLLVIRHAATAWMQEQRFEGRQDQPLTEAGREAALSWRLPLGSRALRWRVSPAQRATETAHQMGVAADPESRLIEMDWGAWEGRTLAELRAAGVSLSELGAGGLDFRPPGGETPREVQKRLTSWLLEVGRLRLATGAVTHTGVLRALYALATGWDMASKAPTKLMADHAHRFAVAPDGTLSVKTLNIPLLGPICPSLR